MIETLIVHILHRKFPFGEGDASYRYRVSTAPKLEYACAIDLKSGDLFHFKRENAEQLTNLIINSKKIVTFRGDEFGLLVLRKHHGFPYKINIGNKHIDLHHELKKIGKENLSLEKAVFSNLGDGIYLDRKAISSQNEDELKACCESDIQNIRALYEKFLQGTFEIKSRPKKPPAHQGIFVTNPGKFVLRPGVTNRKLWYPERPEKYQWNKIREAVLARDNHTCRYCNHKHDKYMNVHHLSESNEHDPENLVTCCVACHAVLHVGRSLAMGVVEVWESDMSQRDIVIKTRELVRQGLSLSDINKSFNFRAGEFAPNSNDYANKLVKAMGRRDRVYLPEPLCAVFINLKRWQI